MEGDTAIDQADKEDTDNFDISPSFLGFPSDLDLGLDSSSLQSEAGPLEASYLLADTEHATVQSRQPNQAYTHDSSQSSSIEPPQQESQGGPQSSSRGSTALSSFISTLLPYNAEGLSNHSTQRLPLARTTVPDSRNQQSENRPTTAHGTSLYRRESATFPSDSEDIGTSSSYDQAASNHSRSASSGSQIVSDRSHQDTELSANPVMASWVRQLSDINVELHQDMLSIPPVEVGQTQGTRVENGGQRNVIGYSQPAKKLAIDRTFKLSQQYTEMLNHIVSRCKSQQGGTEPMMAALTIDQPTQLLVLSSYLCLVESYDKILQHIKGWTEARLNLGVSTSDNQFPIRLPRLAIGSFQLPSSSSSGPLVLTCIMEAMIKNMHDLVSEMMKSVVTGNEASRASHTTAREQGSNGGDELGSVAKVTLQAIRTKENTTMELIHVVWRLALECDTI